MPSGTIPKMLWPSSRAALGTLRNGSSPRNRTLVGLVYIALIVALVVGMDASYVQSAGGHNFAHYF